MTLNSVKAAGSVLATLAISACTMPTSDVSASSATSPTVSTVSTVSVARNLTPTDSGENRYDIYLTGYSYWDNTPPGSAAISKPVIHRQAGGTGTYRDPITIAVGHSITGNRQTLDYPAGTRFYLERLQKYAIVEDVCGDGNNPQNGPCHTGRNGLPWLDIYVDGSSTSSSAATQCTYNITAVQSIIQNPQPNYPVVAGSLAESGCRVF